jgi:dihydroorotase
MCVFVGEPGAEHRETIASASEAAAAGGVTTFLCMPNTTPVIDDMALVDFIKRLARDSALVHVLPTAAITKGVRGEEITEMGLLHDAGAIAFTDGDKAVANARVMYLGLKYAAHFGALVIQHAEEPSLSSGVMNEGELATRLGLSGIPPAAETILVERDIHLMRMAGARYHVAQISTARTIDVVRRAKEEGLPITCAVSAAHLALNENDIGSYRTFFKLSPPLRHEDDRLAMVEGLRAGVIDVVVSGHNPQDAETKRLPFGEAAFGAVGLETLLPVLLGLMHNGHLSLVDALRPVTSTPAKLLGLEAGVLRAGAPADLVLVDPDEPWVVESSKLRSKSKNTPFEGHRFQGRAIQTYVGGQCVFKARGA